MMFLHRGGVMFGFMGGALFAQTGTTKEPTEFELGIPFAHNAVWQQKVKIPVWGKAPPGASVTVRFHDQIKTADALADGSWRVELSPMTAVRLESTHDCPEGKVMTIVCQRANKTVTRMIKTFVIGDVWMCAGQSNMAGKMRTNKTRHFPEDSTESPNYPALRQMIAGDTVGWRICSPETAPDFKKLAFFFGRRVQQDALIPVGLVVAAVGRSNIESWLNQKPYPTGKNYLK